MPNITNSTPSGVSLNSPKKFQKKVFFFKFRFPSHSVRPPKRCFTCQRLGHSAISCKRKIVCPICAESHAPNQCEIQDKEKFKSAFCKENHRATSNTCKYYKEALKLANDVQSRKLIHEQATKLYTKLY